MSNFKQLNVWSDSMKLASYLYTLTRLFPAAERYSLCDQINRAAVSVPSNIAEGYGRFSKKEIMHFLHIARGSLFELETLIVISNSVHYMGDEHFHETIKQIQLIQKQLNALINHHRKNLAPESV